MCWGKGILQVGGNTLFSKRASILLLLLAASLYSAADTITSTGSTSGWDIATSYWYESTYGTSSSVATSYMTSGQTASSSPFSLALSYSAVPANSTITSATLSFNIAGTETGQQSLVTSGGAVTPGYYYTYWVSYSYSCGWSTCYDSYPVTQYYTYGYTSGTMSTGGYETGFLNQIQSGTMTQNVAPTNSGTIDLLALGLGQYLSTNNQLILGGTTNQFQSNSFTNYGWNDYTYFSNTTSGQADVTATLQIDYQQNRQNSVPEPASMALVVSGLGALAMKLRRRS
jgi:hypothetical protein